MTNPTEKNAARSAAMKRAWITRRANAATKTNVVVMPTPGPVVENPTVVVATAPVVVTVVAETPAPAVAKSKPVRKGLTPCLCGCSNMVTADFKQGHDARAKALLAKVAKGDERCGGLLFDLTTVPAVLLNTERGRAFIARHQPVLTSAVAKAVA